MGKVRSPYPPEFRQKMVDLVRAGKIPEELGKEFEPPAISIRNWVGKSNGEPTYGKTSEQAAPATSNRKGDGPLEESQRVLLSTT